jgi:UDP-glucose 4-epimerase
MSESKPVVLVTELLRQPCCAGAGEQRLARSPRGRRPGGRDDEVLIESIGPETGWQNALTGVDAVARLAARVHHNYDKQSFDRLLNEACGDSYPGPTSIQVAHFSIAS